MILAAERERCLTEVLVIAAALSVQDPRDRPTEMAAVADEAHAQFVDDGSDFLGYLKLWGFWREKVKNLGSSALRKQVRNQFLSYVRLREWDEVHRQLNALVTEMGFELNRGEADPDRIHRALLTGLLANVGNKTDTAEYAGVRGSKFFLFPGSVLSKKKPAWVMAAEVVETARLYARTNAKVLPEWIERAAAHLIKRTYTDPVWNPQRAEVTAGEKVTLRGLVIVPHRTVNYGPIDPRTSREVFVHHALVDGDYRTGAAFYKHNGDLLERVRTMEAKARRRDLLADPQQRFTFFHDRVPGDVYSGFLFEKFRKAAEEKQPQLLFMSMADVTREDVTDFDPADYPDQLTVGGMRVDLTYVYDFARADDGVTAHVPLALLNQVPSRPFEWVVPGYLKEKIVDLIRTLPKTTRTKLVPAPDAAAKVIAGLGADYPAAPFLDAVALGLGKLIGELIPPSLFDVKALPAFLRVNFRVTDGTGKLVASGRDLAAIRTQLGVQARESFAALPPAEWTRDGIVKWDFGDVPERVEIRRGGTTFSGFPALVDQGKTVSLRVLDSRGASVVAHRGGVRRLFMLQLEQELRQIARTLHHTEEMTRLYKPLGKWTELKDDFIAAAVDRALFGGTTGDIRTKDAFVSKADDGWRNLSAAAIELNAVALDVLTQYGQAYATVRRDYPPLLLATIEDVRQQLGYLVPRTFLTATPPDQLPHLGRYVKAINVRLTKLLNAGLKRDQDAAATVRPLVQAYVDRRAAHVTRGVVDPQLSAYWWMVQELRVSLFAQELKTAIPVSVPRLEKQWELVQV